MKDPVAGIESHINSLGSRFSDLGLRMIGAGEALASQDAPPSTELFEEIESVRRDFAGLKARVEEVWHKCDLPKGAAAACGGLTDIRTLTASIVDVVSGQLQLDRARQAACDTLERVRSQREIRPGRPDAQQPLESSDSGVQVGGENLVEELRWRQQRIETVEPARLGSGVGEKAAGVATIEQALDSNLGRFDHWDQLSKDSASTPSRVQPFWKSGEPRKRTILGLGNH